MQLPGVEKKEDGNRLQTKCDKLLGQHTTLWLLAVGCLAKLTTRTKLHQIKPIQLDILCFHFLRV